MNRFHVFVLRLILGMAFAVIISRFFYPGAEILYVAGLGAFMVMMAYFMEYIRKKKPDS